MGKHYSGTLVGSEDVMSQLRPFCSNSAIEVKLRLGILKILEQVGEINNIIDPLRLIDIFLFHHRPFLLVLSRLR